MNRIQNTVIVGAPLSVARARQAIDAGLLVCQSCLNKLEFNNGAGPFVSSKRKLGSVTTCYLCEIGMITTAFQVTRTDPVREYSSYEQVMMVDTGRNAIVLVGNLGTAIAFYFPT